MGAKYGIEVIFLPIAHPELNPIEKVWDVIKNIVKSRNCVIDLQDDDGFTMSQLRGCIEYAFEQVARNMWMGFQEKSIEAENMYVEMADVEDAIAFSDESEEENADSL